uniref:Uncharacterized protein n=1 Tax=Oryza brachyantha TaxID=4533 RepID=J3MKL4_ORYBR
LPATHQQEYLYHLLWPGHVPSPFHPLLFKLNESTLTLLHSGDSPPCSMHNCTLISFSFDAKAVTVASQRRSN